MSSSFTDGTTIVQPSVINGYTATRNSRHVFNDILGSSNQDAYVRPAGLRSGALVAVFADRTSAQQLHDMLSATAPILFADTDVPAVGMKFLANGRIDIALDDQTRSAWIVTVDFQEVS